MGIRVANALDVDLSSHTDFRDQHLVLTSVLVAGNFLGCTHPMARVFFGVETTTRCSSLGTFVNFICRRVLYSHNLLLLVCARA